MTDFRFRRPRIFAKGALSGLLLSFAFPPLNWWPMAFVGLTPVLWTLDDLAAARAEGAAQRGGGHAFLLAFSCAFFYFLALLWWIVLLDAPALTIPWVRYPGTAAIVAYLALYFGAFGATYSWVRARTGVPGWIVAPALWVVADIARGYWELGFPWGHLGYSQARFLPALQMASVTGVHGVTAWLVLINALAVAAVRPSGARWKPLTALLLVAAVPPLLGAARLARAPEYRTVPVSLVQPNITNAEKWKPELRAEHFQNMADLSRQGAEQGARLVAWPETAAPTYLLRDERWRPWAESLAVELGVPVLAGFPDYQIVRDESGRRVTYTNSAAMFSAEGELAGRMDKIALVPFGERMPFSSWFDFMAKLDFGEADFIPGDEPVMFRIPEATFGVLVCFEAIYPWLCRRHVLAGADMLVNITNDSWFGAGSGARQHADMSVFRCVETGCGMARAANSGISLGADPYGRTFRESALFTRDQRTVAVPLRVGRTWYVRTGDWVVPLAALVSLGLVGLALARRRRAES
ncbi:MAG TPA: apolipoprotein N-acyltransferase [bacterium]|nr:apolipoprotein N-acyltransferase [bacterium]